MNKTLLEALIHWPKPFITGVDLQVLLDNTVDARKGIVKRAVKEGYLLRLKQNLYVIQKFPQKTLPDTFELAQFIYGPSYISFESALSYHRWIPEAVHVITSASAKKTHRFETSLGIFGFEKIPIAAFSLGIQSKEEGDVRYLIASPWKALADMMYCRKKNWVNIQDLSDDLRIERETLRNSDCTLLELLAKHYPHKKTRNSLERLL